MKTVSGEIVSSQPVSLSKAARILSKFSEQEENGTSAALAAYLRRASSSFNELIQFHRELKGRKSKRSFHYSDISSGGELINSMGAHIQNGDSLEGRDSLEGESERKKHKKNKREGEGSVGNSYREELQNHVDGDGAGYAKVKMESEREEKLGLINKERVHVDDNALNLVNSENDQENKEQRDDMKNLKNRKYNIEVRTEKLPENGTLHDVDDAGNEISKKKKHKKRNEREAGEEGSGKVKGNDVSNVGVVAGEGKERKSEVVAVGVFHGSEEKHKSKKKEEKKD